MPETSPTAWPVPGRCPLIGTRPAGRFRLPMWGAVMAWLVAAFIACWLCRMARSFAVHLVGYPRWSGQHFELLTTVRATRRASTLQAPVTVDAVHILDVPQSAAEHRYTWDLESAIPIPLGG